MITKKENCTIKMYLDNWQLIMIPYVTCTGGSGCSSSVGVTKKEA